MKQETTTMKLTIVVLFALCYSLIHCAPLESRALSSCYEKGQSKLTYYWIPKEGEEDMDNNGNSVTLTGSKTETLLDSNKKVIAKVCQKTKEKILMEGTGLLTNGLLVNLGAQNDEFMVLDRSETPYGLGSGGHGLTPWVSVASNDISIGTTVYVKELDGVQVTDGVQHNGCVRVDDKSWSFGGCHLDFFVLQYGAYKNLKTAVPDSVTAVEKNCEIKNYITSSVKSWAEL